ncbi:MAG TPA: hypothetical protein VFZ58_05625 [Candidatus Saccharimonadales bacterium]
MIKFHLRFFGRIEGVLKSIVCSQTVEALPHPIEVNASGHFYGNFLLFALGAFAAANQGKTFVVYGEDMADEVLLIIDDSLLEQHGGNFTVSFTCKLNAQEHYEGSHASQSETEKIKRALESNGWSWQVNAY